MIIGRKSTRNKNRTPASLQGLDKNSNHSKNIEKMEEVEGQECPQDRMGLIDRQSLQRSNSEIAESFEPALTASSMVKLQHRHQEELVPATSIQEQDLDPVKTIGEKKEKVASFREPDLDLTYAQLSKADVRLLSKVGTVVSKSGDKKSLGKDFEVKFGSELINEKENKENHRNNISLSYKY